MQKRLKEFVIYILENSKNLGPDERAQLEDMRERLSLDGFPFIEIEAAVQSLFNLGELDAESAELKRKLLAPDALAYLQRVKSAGLIVDEQEDEILARAGRLFSDGVSLADIQFLVASLIFDENLATFAVGGFHGLFDGGSPRDQRRHMMH